ncbi:MAG: AI-2E family transporter [Gammaproteobacteria bacterium]|nr:AI-2E family transporter [Gammaproteobacteria bacterium]
MSSEISNDEKQKKQRVFIVNSIEATVRIGLVVLVIYLCLTIIRPFFVPILWGLIIATSLYPIHKWVTAKLGNSDRISAFLITFSGLGLLVSMSIGFSSALIANLKTLSGKFTRGENIIPVPPESLQDWPLIGEPLYAFWLNATQDIEAVLIQFAPELKTFGESLLASVGAMSIGFFQFIAAIVISGFVLANADICKDFSVRFLTRLIGENGPAYADVSGKIVSGVTQGILGVSLIQSALALAGFVVMDVPAAGVWALLCLVLGVVQIGALPVIIGVAIYVFVTNDNTLTTVIFLAWSLVVGVIDNIIKPLVMGRGINVPTVIIFLGAIGGFISSGMIGLFTGAVILVIGYSLFQAWLANSLELPAPEESTE